MLTRIDLGHFKCFEILKLPLRPLTLLSGSNASGKSSLLQALVLLHQTMRDHEWSRQLLLNGHSIKLGTVADVVDQHARRSCEIALETEDYSCRWEFFGEPAEMSMEVTRVAARGVELEFQSSGAYASISSDPASKEYSLYQLYPWQNHELSDAVNLASPGGMLHGLAYLSAEREGPRETYPLESVHAPGDVGARGEHAVSMLHFGGDSRVLDQLVVGGVPPTLLRQVEARMNGFFAGCELDLQKIPQANAVTLGLRTSRDMDFHRPLHTGFGLTQVLPIVVAALSAKSDGVLLIENPEVHLHPAGQAAMGRFLAEVASAGVQVILETHSDHVLSGVRRAVKQNTLNANDAALHFFAPRPLAERKGVAQVQSPMLDDDGNIDAWPDGFFDQFDKDTNYFAGWS
ncbi:MAG: DUF3696 domain-containing protein [Spirochaetaceae bacterium]|nr:DUF3696 domain-containing protein [Spirochaetaceae bacterium]